MATQGKAKYKCLQYLITNFPVEIGYKADKERYNKAWHKLWCGISKLKLFKTELCRHNDIKINRSK
jgi:hypothetical protein